MADSTKIKVGGDSIGISGLEQVLADMAEAFAERSDQEVAAEMLARLDGKNYIAPVAREEYAQAFVREFRKHLGQPYQDGPRQGLEVKILGSGCATCDQLYARTIKVLGQLGLAADVEAIKDIKIIAAHGVMSPPGFMVNGKMVSVGKLPSESQLTQWLRTATR